MSLQKIIIGIGGNIKSNDGSHPIHVGMKAINSLENYSIQVFEKAMFFFRKNHGFEGSGDRSWR